MRLLCEVGKWNETGNRILVEGGCVASCVKLKAVSEQTPGWVVGTR